MGKINRIPRILMIGTLPPPVHGASVMTNVIKESKLINDSVKMDWVNLSTSRSLEEIGKNGLQKYGRLVKSLLRTAQLLFTHKYDLAYITLTCHGGGFLKDAPFALLCKFRGIKLILHQHNKGMKEDVNKGLYRFLFKKVYKKSVVALLSDRLYPDVQDIVEFSQVRVVPNGIALSHETTGGVSAESATSDVNLLFLSNLIPSKGVYVLLDALKILKERDIRFNCRIIGAESADISAGRLEKEIEERGLQGKVSYIGKKFEKEKEAEFRKADVFVFPTMNDAFPLVILEAMQFGLPVVTTSEGGILDMVKDGETGLICQSRDYTELAERIQCLIENETLRKELGHNGRVRFMERFTLPIFEKNILDLLLNEAK